MASMIGALIHGILTHGGSAGTSCPKTCGEAHEGQDTTTCVAYNCPDGMSFNDANKNTECEPSCNDVFCCLNDGKTIDEDPVARQLQDANTSEPAPSTTASKTA